MQNSLEKSHVLYKSPLKKFHFTGQNSLEKSGVDMQTPLKNPIYSPDIHRQQRFFMDSRRISRQYAFIKGLHVAPLVC